MKIGKQNSRVWAYHREATINSANIHKLLSFCIISHVL